MHACRCCWIWRSEGMRGGRQMKEGRDGWRDGWMHQGQVFSSVAGLSGWLVVSLLSALEWLGPGLQRMGWPVLHIYIYHSHCHAVCVCVACALCVFEYANKIRQCLWFCACVGVRACAAAIVEHPDVSAASLGVCHWDSGGGVKVTCFKYRQCHDNMPDSTYKSHLHNISPVSLSFSRFFSPPSSSWETGSAHTSCFAFVSAVQMRKDVMSRLSPTQKRHNCIPASHNGERHEIQTQRVTAGRKDKTGFRRHNVKWSRPAKEACQYSMSPLNNRLDDTITDKTATQMTPSFTHLYTSLCIF